MPSHPLPGGGHLRLLAIAAALFTVATGAIGALTPIAANSDDDTAVRNGPIAFGRFDPNLGDVSLWTAHANGTHQRRLTTIPSMDSDWAPDGASLIFDYFHGNDEHIASINRDGSHQTQRTFGSGIQGDPRYSPNGRQIPMQSI